MRTHNTLWQGTAGLLVLVGLVVLGLLSCGREPGSPMAAATPTGAAISTVEPPTPAPTLTEMAPTVWPSETPSPAPTQPPDQTPVVTVSPEASPTASATSMPSPTPTLPPVDPTLTPTSTAAPLPSPLPEGAFVFPAKNGSAGATFKVLSLDAKGGLSSGAIVSPLGRFQEYVDSWGLSPDRRLIAINLANEEGGDLAVVWADGSRFLWPIEGGGRFLDWIPGTDRMLVGGNPVGGAMTVRFDGSDPHGLSYGPVFDGAVSPDGQRIVLSVVGQIECPYHCFYYCSADGTETSYLPVPDKAPGGEAPRELTWAPDGTRIAYVDSSYDWSRRIRTIDAHGGDVQSYSPDEMECWSPAWSPDSNYLVYVCEESETRTYWYIDRPSWVSSIWLADVTTGGARQILPADGKANWWPTWLPDGSGIVFASNRGGANDLWFVRPDGTGLQQATFDGDAGY